MQQPDILDYIDDRNIKLWEYVSQHYNIRLEYSNEPNYGVYTQKDMAIIYVLNDNSKAAFTHELLHIELKIKKIFIGGCLTNEFRADSVLYKVFQADLIEHLSNCLEHSKMLPYFINMGYDRKGFISDYKTNKCTLKELRIIFFYHCFAHSRRNAINYFVGKFFAIKACPNIGFNYRLKLSSLKHINKSLFKILNKFWKAWESFDINNRDHDYYQLCNTFINDLNKWAISKSELINK